MDFNIKIILFNFTVQSYNQAVFFFTCSLFDIDLAVGALLPAVFLAFSVNVESQDEIWLECILFQSWIVLISN